MPENSNGTDATGSKKLSKETYAKGYFLAERLRHAIEEDMVEDEKKKCPSLTIRSRLKRKTCFFGLIGPR